MSLGHSSADSEFIERETVLGGPDLIRCAVFKNGRHQRGVLRTASSTSKPARRKRRDGQRGPEHGLGVLGAVPSGSWQEKSDLCPTNPRTLILATTSELEHGRSHATTAAPDGLTSACDTPSGQPGTPVPRLPTQGNRQGIPLCHVKLPCW